MASSSGRRTGWAAVVGGLAILASACQPQPSSSLSGETTQPTPSATAESASPSGPTALEWHSVDRALTTPLLATAATDTAILWSAGPDAPGNFAPDLYRYSIASGVAEKVVASENRTSSLLPIAGSAAGYAYVEGSAEANGVTTWKLWYRPDVPDAEPMLVDEMDSVERPTPSPTIAMDDRWLVWASVHERSGRAVSELAVLDLQNFESSIIESTPAARGGYWFPSLDAGRLVYGKIATAPTPSAQIYLVDLPAAGAPTRLDADGDAAMPGISGDWVIWKRNPTNAFDWGGLVRYSLASAEATPIQLGDEPEVNYPTVGSRFVTAWELESTTFYAYDLVADEPIIVEALPPDSPEANVRPSVHGRLLVWTHVLPGDDLELRWAQLPE